MKTMKYQITSPVKDFSGVGVAGTVFEGGHAVVDSEKSPSALSYFQRRAQSNDGWKVEPIKGESGEPGNTGSTDAPEGDPTDEWSVPQLRAWAKDHDVDLKGLAKKDEILAAVAPTPAGSTSEGE